MSVAGELVAELADLARAKGITRLEYSGDRCVVLEFGPLPSPKAAEQTLFAISRPTGSDETGDKAEKASRVAAYLDAVENAHNAGYPSLATYGLSPGDLP